MKCIIQSVGWGLAPKSAGCKSRPSLNIDSARQCQLGRRIAPPVIATFELARVFPDGF